MVSAKITALDADALPAAADVVAIVVGTAGTPITKKMTHDDLLFGANGTPSTQAHGDSAAIGTALDAARSDHKHAMPAASGSPGSMSIFPQAVTGTATLSKTVNTYAVTELGSVSADGVAYFSWEVPADFTSLTGLVLRYAPNGTGTLRHSTSSRMAAVGEAKDSNSDSISSADAGSQTNDQMEELDLSAAITAIAAGDTIGLAWTREGSHANDSLTSVKIMDLLFEYS